MSFVFDKETFAKAVKQKRVIDLGIGMREASDVTGVSISTLSRVENKKPFDMKTFATLCGWLKVDINTFFKSSKIK